MNKHTVDKRRNRARFTGKNIAFTVMSINGMTTGKNKINSILSNCFDTFQKLTSDLQLNNTEYEIHKNAMSEICKDYISDNVSMSHDLLLTKANKLTQLYVNAYLM